MKKNEPKFITFNGKTLTLRQWSIETQISYYTLRARLKCGWQISLALTQKPRTHSIKITHNGKTQTVKQWALELGITPNTIYSRLYKKLDKEQVLSPFNRGGVVIPATTRTRR